MILDKDQFNNLFMLDCRVKGYIGPICNSAYEAMIDFPQFALADYVGNDDYSEQVQGNTLVLQSSNHYNTEVDSTTLRYIGDYYYAMAVCLEDAEKAMGVEPTTYKDTASNIFKDEYYENFIKSIHNNKSQEDIIKDNAITFIGKAFPDDQDLIYSIKSLMAYPNSKVKISNNELNIKAQTEDGRTMELNYFKRGD